MQHTQTTWERNATPEWNSLGGFLLLCCTAKAVPCSTLLTNFMQMLTGRVT